MRSSLLPDGAAAVSSSIDGRRRHVDRLFGGGDELFLLRCAGGAFTRYRLVDLVVLVGHGGTARVLGLHLDRAVVGLDDRRRIAGAVSEGERKGADSADKRYAADERRKQHPARLRLLAAFGSQMMRLGDLLVEIGVVVVSVRRELGAGRHLASRQVVGVERKRIRLRIVVIDLPAQAGTPDTKRSGRRHLALIGPGVEAAVERVVIAAVGRLRGARLGVHFAEQVGELGVEIVIGRDLRKLLFLGEFGNVEIVGERDCPVGDFDGLDVGLFFERCGNIDVFAFRSFVAGRR